MQVRIVYGNTLSKRYIEYHNRLESWNEFQRKSVSKLYLRYMHKEVY